MKEITYIYAGVCGTLVADPTILVNYSTTLAVQRHNVRKHDGSKYGAVSGTKTGGETEVLGENRPHSHFIQEKSHMT
jgi:hypothetical protein